MKKLGHVTVDGYRAAVVFRDLSDDSTYFRVTITFRKPEGRLHRLPTPAGTVLERDGNSDDPPRLATAAAGPTLPEIPAATGDGAGRLRLRLRRGLRCRANCPRVSRDSVDGRPKASALEDTGGIPAATVAAWREIGCHFHPVGTTLDEDEVAVPGFSVSQTALYVPAEGAGAGGAVRAVLLRPPGRVLTLLPGAPGPRSCG